MVSRYFTMKEGGHFPNSCACIEVTRDGKYLRHHDDGRVVQNTELQGTALNACLNYVRNGMWIEIDSIPMPQDRPTTAFEIW